MRAGVLFDLDGVLADSYDVWFEVLNDVALRLGRPPIRPAQLEAAFGQGLAADRESFYPGTPLPELARMYAEAFPRHISRMRANPEAQDVLDGLRRSGAGTAVVTNTPQGLAEDILHALDLHARVDVVSGVRPGVREKPAPDLLLDALARLDIPAGAALMIGDSSYDEQAALAAGVPFRRYEMKVGTSLGTFLSDAP